MPSLDGTGPLGYGSLRGRRGGYCRNSIPLRRAFSEAGSIRRGSGMGGFGRGFRWQYLETGQPRWTRTLGTGMSSQTEDMAALQTELEQEVKALEEQLNDVKSCLESLKLETSDESEEINSDTVLEKSE